MERRIRKFWATILKVCMHKGQTNSKCFFQADVSSKKRMNIFNFTTCFPLFFGKKWRHIKEILKLTHKGRGVKKSGKTAHVVYGCPFCVFSGLEQSWAISCLGANNTLIMQKWSAKWLSCKIVTLFTHICGMIPPKFKMQLVLFFIFEHSRVSRVRNCETLKVKKIEVIKSSNLLGPLVPCGFKIL